MLWRVVTMEELKAINEPQINNLDSKRFLHWIKAFILKR